MTNDMARTIEDPSSPARERRISLRARLRGGSGDRHERLDRCFEGMHDADDTGLYRRFIRVNAACHAGIEPILDDSPLKDAIEDWPSRNRATSLAEDLRAMHLSAFEPLPFPIGRPSLAEAFGIAYVLEGSRLGARYIHRLVSARIREDVRWKEAAAGYLASAADETDYFRSFMDEASRHLTTDRDEAEAVAAANATFDYFIETERAEKAAALDL